MYDFRYYANMPMYFIVTKCCAKGSIQSSQKWKLKIIGPIWARKFIFTVLQNNKKNFTFFNDDVQTKMACLSTTWSDSELAKLACMTSDTMLTWQCILLWPNVAQKGQYRAVKSEN